MTVKVPLPLADGFREALFRWGEARGLQVNDRLFLGGSLELEQRFLEVLAPTPWRKCRWHATRVLQEKKGA